MHTWPTPLISFAIAPPSCYLLVQATKFPLKMPRDERRGRKRYYRRRGPRNRQNSQNYRPNHDTRPAIPYQDLLYSFLPPGPQNHVAEYTSTFAVYEEGHVVASSAHEADDESASN